jgi:hypothetical protein
LENIILDLILQTLHPFVVEVGLKQSREAFTPCF